MTSQTSDFDPTPRYRAVIVIHNIKEDSFSVVVERFAGGRTIPLTFTYNANVAWLDATGFSVRHNIPVQFRRNHPPVDLQARVDAARGVS